MLDLHSVDPPANGETRVAGRDAARRVATWLASVGVKVAVGLVVARLAGMIVPALGRTVVGEIRPLGAIGFGLFAATARELAKPSYQRRAGRVAFAIVALAAIGVSGWMGVPASAHPNALVRWLSTGSILASSFTATGFVLASLALVEIATRARPRFFQAPAFLLLVFGSTAILGLSIARDEIREVWIYHGVHFAGALGQTVMGLCLLCLRPDVGFLGTVTRTDPTGILARRMAFGLVLIPLLTWAVDLLGSHGVGLWGDHFGTALIATLDAMLFVGLLWVGVETLERTARDRQQVERQLASARGAYHHMVETMGEGVWAFGADLRTTFVNRRVTEMMGYASDELLGHFVAEFMAAEDRPSFERHMELRRRGVAESYDHRLIRKDGAPIWVIVNASPFLDESGRFTGSLATLTDITARRAADQALRESEERFQQIAANVSELFWIRQLDPERILYASPAFERIWGISTRTLERKPGAWLDSIHPADVESVRSTLGGNAGKPDSNFDLRYRVVRRDGSTRWVHDRGHTLSGLPGEADRLVGIATDITDEVLSEERRTLLMGELDHRVKNTLATVVALLDLTLDKDASVEELREALTSRIYAMARTHEGLARHRWEAMPVMGVAKLALAPWLSLPSERITLTGEPVRLPSRIATPLSLALNELATNSLKYGALASPQGTVRVSWRGGSGQDLELTWTERGGPPVQAPAHLGTGLTLIHDLVDYQLHGSFTIAFEAAGVSAALHFPLPRGSADSDTNLFRKTPPPAPGVETPGDDGALRGVRVLVVEDDQLQARMLARLLQRLGCEVIDVASTVHAALESAEHAELEGAVLDVNLGTATSAAVADALARRGIPYFFVTGYARAEVLPPHLADVPRLGKPVEPANLEALARKLFAHGSA